MRAECAGFFLGLSLAAGAQPPTASDVLPIREAPSISNDPAEKLRPYTDIRPSSVLAWHTDGVSLLVRTVVNRTAQLLLVTGAGTKPTPLIDDAGTVWGAHVAPTKGEYLLLEKTNTANGLVGIFRFDLATQALTPVSDPALHASAPAWDPSGQRIVYTSTAQVSGSRVTRLVMADPLHPEARKTITTFNGNRRAHFRFSPDGKHLVFLAYPSANESQIWTLNLALGLMRLVTPSEKGSPTLYGAATYSAEGRALYATTNRDSEFQRLVKIDLASGKHLVLTPKLDFDVGEFALSFEAKRIAFVTNEAGVDVLRFLDLTTLKELPRPALLPGEISGLRWKPGAANAELAFNLASARSPGDVYTWNFATSKISRYTSGATPGLNPLDLVEPKLVDWKGADGTSISGFLYAPEPGKFPGKRPIVVRIHADPGRQARGSFVGRDNYLINELGVALLFANVPGVSGFGRIFQAKGRDTEIGVRDLGNLIDWIKQQRELDADRLLVVSDSGTVARAVVGRYAALVNFDEGGKQSVRIVGAHRQLELPTWLEVNDQAREFSNESNADYLFFSQIRLLEEMVRK